MATASSKFTIEDLVVKRLWVEDKRIDSFNLGALVIRDENYNIGVNTDDPEMTLDISGNSGIRIPIGSDSTRPNISEMTGILRYNSDSEKEYYESYIQGSWRPIGGSNLELCTVSGSSKSSILINKKGLTSSNDGGTIEFNLESEGGIKSKQAKILAKNVSSAGNGSLTFQTAENDSYHDRIFIKNNGDVGIGNASPGKKLHVSGDLQAQDIFTDGGLKNINSTGTFVNLGTNEIYLGVNGTAQLYVSSNNNVGIGTQPSSSYKLHVNGSIAGQSMYASLVESATINATSKLGIKQNNPQVVLDINDTGAIQLPKGTTTQRDSLPTIRQGMVRYNTTTEQFEGYGAGNAWGSLGGVKDIDQDTFITVSDGTTDTDEIKFFAGNTSTEKMIIKSSGNVGIGTTSPTEKLHINGTVNNSHFAGLYLMNSGTRSSGNVKSAGIKFNVYEPSDVAITSEIRSAQDDDGYRLDFYTTYSSASQRTMTLRDGNVGIGTTSPSTKFTVRSSAAYQGIRLEDSTGNNKINMASSGTGGSGHAYFNMWNSSNAQSIQIHSSPDHDTWFNSRNVGIGTDSPSKKLHVQDGDILVRGNNAARHFFFQYKDDNGYFGGHSNAVIGSIDFQGNEQMSGDSGYENFRTYAAIKAHKGTSNGTFGAGLRFYTHENTEAAYNLQERMCILPNGNVGIGTTEPESALDVTGQIVIRKTSTDLALADGTFPQDYYLQIGGAEYASISSFPDGVKRLIGFGYRDSNTVDSYIGSVTSNSNSGEHSDIIFGTANDTEFTTDPTEKMRITHDGNVGIGETSPGKKLQVAGDVVLGYIYGTNDGLWMSNSHSSGAYGTSPFIQGVTSGFGTKDIALNPNGGNVGIGINSPQDKIHTTGNIRIGGTGVIRAAQNAYNHSGTITLQAAGSGNSSSDVHSFKSSAGSELKFGKDGSYFLHYKQKNVNTLYINDSNQVGINTGSSMTTVGGYHKLCINNSLALIHDANHLMYARCSTAGYASFQYYDSGANSGYVELQPYGGIVILANEDKGSDRVVIRGGCSVRQKSSWSKSHLSYSTNGDWYIRTGTTSGNIRICDTGGKVYIGDTSDSSDLLCYGYVACGLHSDAGAGTAVAGNKTLWISSRNKNGFNYGWWIGAQKETPATNDNDLYFNVCRGNSTGHVAGYIQDAYSDVRMNFTGQHRTHVKDIPHTKIESYIGLIVCANNNEYVSMTYMDNKKSIQKVNRGKKAIEISESLPIVSLCIKEKDKSCFGVISNVEDEETRTDGGNFTSCYTKELGDTRTFINSLGEGAIWVTNINGNLESGDYITTSKLPGYGQKQNEEYLANYTVAKITMDCDFNPPVQKIYKIKKHEKEVVYYRNEIQIPPDEEIEEIPDRPEKDKKEIFYENHKFHTMDISKNILWLELDENTYLKEKDIKIYKDYDFNRITKKEMINVLDENNEFIWEETDEYETAYHLRYLTEDGTIINRGVYESKKINGEKVYIAAFVGCTYHCG